MHCMSAASVSTSTSTGSDSLLESFTFVPPSPIASCPSQSLLSQAQTPPQSANSITTNSVEQQGSPSAWQLQGMSTISAMSSSSALEGFMFHINAGSMPPSPPVPCSQPTNQHLNSRQVSTPLHSQLILSTFLLNFDEVPCDSFGVLWK